MQAAGVQASEQSSWLDPEEPIVTFQIALVGCDGLVIGSDRLGRYVPVIGGLPKLPQIVRQRKYCVSDNGSLICFASGGPMGVNLARRILAECDPESILKGKTESQWEEAVRQLAAVQQSGGSGSAPPAPDQILIARSDVVDSFWMLLIRADTKVVLIKMEEQFFCAGASTVAQFLPRHLWNNKRSISDLQKLALLTLSYAAQEEPSSVGPPFDIMTLDQTGQISWSVHDPMHEKFQSGLEALFLES